MDGTTTTSASTVVTGEISGAGKALACSTCGVSFERTEDQRTHGRSDWHVYNLKRSVASLPPLSQTIFKERFGKEQIQQGGDHQDTSSFFKTCPGCEKEFYSLKAWRNHVEKSRCIKEIEPRLGLEGAMGNLALEHHDRVKNDEVNEDDSQVDDDNDGRVRSTQESFNPLKCLFCSNLSDSLDANMSHMHKIHGLFIPDQEYLIDLTSLLSYFYTIIHDFHECLYCGKDLSNGGGKAVRMHMIAKGHCNINLDDVSELEDFYEFNEVEDGKDQEEGEVLDKETGKGKAKETKILTPERDGTIHLPSGKTLGRRSQSHLYRQNTHPYRGTPAERFARQKLAIEELKSASSTAPSGHNGPTSESAEDISAEDEDAKHNSKKKVSIAIQKLGMERVRGINTGQLMMRKTDATSLIGLSEGEKRAVVAMERKMMRMEMRTRNDTRWSLEKKANKQARFRPDDPGPPLG